MTQINEYYTDSGHPVKVKSNLLNPALLAVLVRTVNFIKLSFFTFRYSFEVWYAIQRKMD